jgi:hypothetical protein
MIEAERIEKVQSQEDKKSTSYEKIQIVLEKNTKANPEVEDIRTLRKSPDGAWTYVLGGFQTHDVNEDGIITELEKGISVGEEFDASSFPGIAMSFDGPSADHAIACDKRGCFISGYAPIKDRFGQASAITQVNIKAQNILDFEKNIKITILATLISVLVFFPILLCLILHFLIGSEPITKESKMRATSIDKTN